MKDFFNDNEMPELAKYSDKLRQEFKEAKQEAREIRKEITEWETIRRNTRISYISIGIALASLIVAIIALFIQ